MVTTRPPKTIVKPTALGPVENTDTKLLIYGLFQKGRVLAQDGMEETLTVVKLALPALLRQSLATTNAIENLNGTIRRVSRNVKRWKSPSMVRRWTALGVVTAQKEFRRIKGYRHMGALVHALRSKQKSLDSDEFAA